MILALMLLLLTAPARAEAPPNEGGNRVATAVKDFVFHQTKTGMLVRLPTFDVDPNIGPTYGFVAVWVNGTAESTSTIKSVHAPSVDYNSHFGITGAYQYFYFPSRRTDISIRGSLSQYWNRELVAEFETKELGDRNVYFDGRAEHSRDGAKHFFGIGPNTPESGESNYTLDTLNYCLTAGIPLWDGSPLSVQARHALQADEIEGSFPPIPDTVQAYPAQTRGLQYRRINVSHRAYLIYDTRDSADTTSAGTYAETFIGASRTDLLSAYNYTRYGATLKTFLPAAAGAGDEPKFISALRVTFEDLNGSPPFYLLPELGGKYSLRSYGDGRFYDHSMIDATIEERCRVYQKRIAGIPLSFWVDPFVSVGTVSAEPDLMRANYMHPAFGAALRVVSRPQIVESLDFGYGQEGLKTFLDVRYSF
ncbi:MAG TPA: hypothetical protein VN915_00015 [Elusimicrobiota bacterium]|nr:hypothetical protein [Elusimicrobiota bacterium]